MQYPEWKTMLKYGYNAIEHKSKGYTKQKSRSKVESEALRNVEIRSKMEMIEQAAVAACDGEFYEELLLNVTEKMPYEDLGLPLSRADFSALRRKFFYELSIRRH